MIEMPKRILIVLLGAIGDVVRGLPLAMRIKRSWPAVELHWAVEPISLPIVECHPALDKIIVFDRPGGIRAYQKFISALRQEKYDLVLDLQRHFKSGLTSRLSGAPVRIGFGYKNARELNWLFNNQHLASVAHLSSKIVQFQRFGDFLKLPPSEPLVFGLNPSLDQKSRLEDLIKSEAQKAQIDFPEHDKRAALILGSTWESRFWKAEYYVSLIKEMKRLWGISPILIGGRLEREFAVDILKECNGLPVLNFVEKTGLGDLVSLFSNVRFAVGSDSGPMHLAAAAGCPVISLWGSTGSKRSAPYGSEAQVLESAIGCSPCYRRKCPGLDTLCMSEIKPEQVLVKIQEVLSSSCPETPLLANLERTGD